MKVAVFGAAGWLGRAVLKNLTGRHAVRAVDRDPAAWRKYDDLDGTWDEGQKYIYESPDGGKTIYRRKFGEDDREEMEKGL